MRNLISILAGCLWAMFLMACSNPLDYNTSVMNEVSDVEDADTKIYEQILAGNIPGIEAALQDGEEQVSFSIGKIKRLPGFRGDDSLRQAAMTYLLFYDHLFRNDYDELLRILKNTKEIRANTDRLKEITDQIPDDKMNAKKQFITIHFRFVTKNGLIPVRKGDIFDN